MAFTHEGGSGRTSLVFTGLLVAVGVWGAYAWRHAGSGDASPSSPTLAFTVQNQPPTDERPTPLRATRPTPDLAGTGVAAHRVEDTPPVELSQGELASATRANAPPSDHQELVISLRQHANPERVAPAPPALEAARREISRGRLIAARELLARALGGGLPATDDGWARGELSRLADALLFSRAFDLSDPLVGVHIVAPGDSLGTIARKYQVTPELLARINEMSDPNRIAVGQRLKMLRGPFRGMISKSAHRLDVYLGTTLVRSFGAGLGQNSNTPTGLWTVSDKLANPDWTHPATNRHYPADDPENPIGEHWIGLRGLSGEALGRTGFGIHGTIDAASVGQDSSLGCVRLLPADVACLFDLLVPQHSLVEITP